MGVGGKGLVSCIKELGYVRSSNQNCYVFTNQLGMTQGCQCRLVEYRHTLAMRRCTNASRYCERS